MTLAIQVNQLQQGYGKTMILKNIDFKLATGQICALIGPSGSGKTTLINSIMGMLAPQSGTVKVFGQTMPQREMLGKIGFMGQTDALYFNLTGYENLKFFGKLQNLKKAVLQKRIAQTTQVVVLKPALKKLVKNYSGGMKRRLSLAIALLAEPDLLILDEPTVGIDPELRLNIWHELHQQASRGKAILLTTHVMADAQQADKLLLLQNGTLIAQGSPEQLMRKYQADSVEAVFLKAERRVTE